MSLTLRQRRAGDWQALSSGLSPVLRRVLAARGVTPDTLSLTLSNLLPPTTLKGLDAACAQLQQAITGAEGIVITGDYDADGATATALAVLGLRALGATRVDYVVPDRFVMGYGLSPALAEGAARTGARVLVTVDSGISSVAGVARAQALGMRVVITDHHLAGDELPAAEAIVNPNQPGCPFASKHLAGVGVMFYVLLALRAALRAQGWFTAARPEPKLAQFLDLVAVGTVADVVRLDINNRILVEQGLLRMRAGHLRPGLRQLFKVAGRQLPYLNAQDLGFALGPRINAAGRLDDITTGIECLLAEDPTQAEALAQQLDTLNQRRRQIETDMRDDAELLLDASDAVGLCLFHDDWHEGVVGIVAGRVKEQRHRPVFAFARAQASGMLKGSGRSIAGLHLRDALATIDAQNPGLMDRFGGHAMAAGLTLPIDALPAFSALFDAYCRAALDEAALAHVLETDGALSAEECSVDTAAALERAGPWGQGFAEPLFEGQFKVMTARPVGAEGKHIKYQLRLGDTTVDAIDFGGAERMQSHGSVYIAYALAVNRWQGRERIDLRVAHLQPA